MTAEPKETIDPRDYLHSPKTYFDKLREQEDEWRKTHKERMEEVRLRNKAERFKRRKAKSMNRAQRRKARKDGDA